MAFTADQLNQVYAVVPSAIEKEIINQLLVTTALLNTVTKKPILEYFDGGADIQIPVQKAKNKSGGFFSGGFDQRDISSNQLITNAKFDLKYQDYSVTTTLKEIALTSGANAVVSLIEEKVKLAAQDAANVMAEGLFGSGSDSDGFAINGFTDIFAASGTAYGGLTNTDFDDNTTWLTEIDTSTNTINFANINGLVGKLINKGGQRYAPKLMISNSYVQDKFLNSQQSQQRFTSENDLKSGFAGVKFRNIDWFVDEYCQGSGDAAVDDNHLYIIAPETMSLKYKYGFEGKNAPTNMNAPLPNQSAVLSKHDMAYNLVCKARRYNGVFKNLQS